MRGLWMFLTYAILAFAPALANAQNSPAGSPLLAQLGSRLSTLPGPFEALADPATRFKPSGRRVMLTAFVNEAASGTDERQSIRSLLESVFKSYESAAEKGGMAHDLAGALAFYVGASYRAYMGGAELSETGSAFVARQIQAALDTPQMRAASDLEKQQLYETYIMLAGLLAARQEIAKGDAAAIKELRPFGADGLKQLLKVDLSRVKITDEGLRITPIGGAGNLPAKSSALKTLLFTAAAPWVRQNHADGITLTLRKEGYLNSVHTVSVVLTGALPIAGSLQKSLHKYWREQVLSIMKGNVQPFAMVSIHPTGARYASAEKSLETRAGGIRWNVIYQLIDGGDVVYPVMILQSENFSDPDGQLDRLLATLRVPGGAPPAKPLATTADLARSWSTAASSVMNYVNTYTGANAGTSVIAYRQSYSLKPNGTYTGSFNGINNGRVIKSTEKGTYRLQGNRLIFKESNGRTTTKYFLGIDTPPGATGPIMLLLNPGYPANSANIGLYGEKYGLDGK